MTDFFQEPPSFSNTYSEDRLLQIFLQWRLPVDLFPRVNEDLVALGNKACGEYLELAREAQRDLPVHLPFGAWGHRQDRLQMSHAWEKLHRISAEEGMVAIGYAREQGPVSALPVCKALFVSSEFSLLHLSLAMADGAARVMETYASAEVKNRFYPRLTTRNPDEFWTSGQWMTEKPGAAMWGVPRLWLSRPQAVGMSFTE